jgi:hypothetical protein
VRHDLGYRSRAVETFQASSLCTYVLVDVINVFTVDVNCHFAPIHVNITFSSKVCAKIQETAKGLLRLESVFKACLRI